MSTIAQRAAKMAATKPKTKTVTPKPEVETMTGPEIPMAIHLAEATICVYGHDNLSKRDVELLALCLDPSNWPGIENTTTTHGVRIVRFMADGRPVSKEGKPIFANSCPELGGITINLSHCFIAAVTDCLEDPEISLWAKFNQHLMQSYLHEINHIRGRQTEEDRQVVEEMGKGEEEELSEKFSFYTLLHMAKNTHIEPNSYLESPFFVKSLNKLFTKGNNDSWCDNQRHMLENNLYYHLAGTDETNTLEVHTFKTYIQLLDGEGADSEDWEKDPTHSDLSTIVTLSPMAPTPQAAVASVNPAMDDLFDGPEEVDIPHAQPYDGVNHYPPAAAPVQPAPVVNQAPPAVAPETHMATPPAALSPTGLDEITTGAIIQGVYNKVYQHIFGNCGQLLHNDLGFSNPEAATSMPIALTPQEQQVVFKCDCQSPMGQYQPGSSTEQGLRGYISKSKLPMYKLYLNVGGQEVVRVLIPQNPAKQGADGQYSNPALQARGGSQILYVMEGNDQKAATNGKFIMKFVDGQMIKC